MRPTYDVNYYEVHAGVMTPRIEHYEDRDIAVMRARALHDRQDVMLARVTKVQEIPI